MAKTSKHGRTMKVIYVEATPELSDRLKAVAKRNRRSSTQEAIIAIEQHVEREEERMRQEKGEQQ